MRKRQTTSFGVLYGESRIMHISYKAKVVCKILFDLDSNPVKISHDYKRLSLDFDKPAAYDEIKKLAARLSLGISFYRIDFFYVNGKV